MFQKKHLGKFVIGERYCSREAEMFQNQDLHEFWGKEETHSRGPMTFVEHSLGGVFLNLFLEDLPKVIRLWTLLGLFAQRLQRQVVNGGTMSRERGSSKLRRGQQRS